MTNIIETNELTFHFRKKRNVVSDLNLRVPQGSVYGFLGPNGAGKSTTIRLMAGLLFPAKGTVSLFGLDLRRKKAHAMRNAAYMIEEPTIYKHLTGKQNLEILCKAGGYAKSRIDEVLKNVELFDDRNRKAGAYSMGMKQRLGIAGALIPDPELFILDEPTNGLDPQGMYEIRELIVDLNKRLGKTIFISSHLLGEIEKMCTHVGIIHQGKGLYEGSISDLGKFANALRRFRIETSNPQKAVELLKPYYEATLTSDNLVEITPESRYQQSEVVSRLIQSQLDVYQAYEIKNNLEEMFIQVTENKSKNDAK